MRFLSVCSGIEAASVAWNPLGWKAWAFSEIVAFPCAVLAHHYPDTPNLGDMTKFKDWPDATLDLLCGGTPCQSFSNAGLRAGLDDPRGQLMLTFGAIAARYRPRWLVWENVPGVLSSNGGRDFGAFLGLLGHLGYGFAYRVLDAQYVRVDGYARAVPQRRQRVFVVGCLGDWRSAAAVLLERESLRGDPAPRRRAGARVAPCLDAGPDIGGDGSRVGRLIEVAGSLAGNGPGAGWRIGPDEAAAGQLVAYGGNNTRGPISVSSALSAHGGTGRHDFESETFIAHTLRGDGFDASEDGTGRGTPIIPIDMRQASRGGTMTNNRAEGACSGGAPGIGVGEPGDPAFTVSERGQAICFDTTQITSASNYSNPKPGDPCHPLAAGAHAPAIAFNWQGGGTQTTLGYDPEAGTTGALHVGQTPAVAYSTKLHNTKSNQAGKVYEGYTVGLDRNSPPPALLTAAAVRRLMPVECERLQGFPDGYTAVVHRGKPAADGPRYKALGNSWAIPPVRWIGMRIAMVDSLRVRALEAA